MKMTLFRFIQFPMIFYLSENVTQRTELTVNLNLKNQKMIFVADQQNSNRNCLVVGVCSSWLKVALCFLISFIVSVQSELSNDETTWFDYVCRYEYGEIHRIQFKFELWRSERSDEQRIRSEILCKFNDSSRLFQFNDDRYLDSSTDCDEYQCDEHREESNCWYQIRWFKDDDCA